MAVSNQDIARTLYTVAELLEMKEVQFKPRAYEKAARSIEALEEPAAQLYAQGGLQALEDIPGVGASIAKKIEELLDTGHLQYLEELEEDMPADVGALTAIEGVGPKTVEALWKELGVKTVDDLERVAKAGKIRQLKGFGKKTEENILKGIRFRREHGTRFLLNEAVPMARTIEKRLQELPEVGKAVVAGSIRRYKETIGDADVLVVSEEPDAVVEFFVSMPEVVNVYARGETKTMVRLANGMDVDMRIVPPDSFGAALHYFTGSKEHNVALRKAAIKKGWKLNEYGLFQEKKAKRKKQNGKEQMIAGKTEAEIYQKLDFAYIVPEMREMTGELELAAAAFRQGKREALPELIGYSDLQGDLQVQSNWTDGRDSIKALAKEAKHRGLRYIAITDHTKRLAMTHGLDEKRLKKQMQEIDALNKKISGITILKGTECDILKDGSLDLPDSALARLDVVGVSVHSYFSMSKKEMTERIVRAITNPYVTMLFHPTGRRLGKRKAYEVDMEAVVRAAKKHGVFLEANASPERLDLHDAHIRMAVEEGVKLVINSDAHAASHFSFLEYGIAQARRGWAKKSDVVNALPLKEFLTACRTRR